MEAKSMIHVISRTARHALTIAALLLTLAAHLSDPGRLRADDGGEETPSFRVMTFNIRFDYSSDRKNRWKYRADLVARTILQSEASVVLLQEDKEDQLADLQERLPDFSFLGRGRNENGSGERCAVAFDKTVWRSVRSGDFWLSDTPREQGSNTWNTRYPHKVTWALLKHVELKGTVLFLSTHFENARSRDDVREKSAEVLRDFLKRQPRSLPIVLGGDFNCEEGALAHDILTDPEARHPLADVWLEVQPDERSPGTIHFFEGKSTSRRIDWLLASRELTPLRIFVDRYCEDGRYPSDHYPVAADLAVE